MKLQSILQLFQSMIAQSINRCDDTLSPRGIQQADFQRESPQQCLRFATKVPMR
jgi:hypothetical protein